MAGGSGTRLWPVSRTSKPKQFLDVAGVGKTLIRDTFDRFAKIIPEENILIVTGGKYSELVKTQIPELKEENLLVEPYARNTAPCIAYASYALLKRDPEAVMVVTPSDHIISNNAEFEKTIKNALEYVSKEPVLMTLGIKPTRPDTNFGYIQIKGGRNASTDSPIKVKTFIEKPYTDLAKVLVDSGEFFWNSGIFVWKADTIIAEMEKQISEITIQFNGWEKAIGSKGEQAFINRAYTDCPNTSIDYGVMEKTEKAWLFPATFDWADIGSWESLAECLGTYDQDGNLVLADKALTDADSKDIFITKKSGKLLAISGLKDYVVIDTDDVLLICPKNDKQFKDFIAGIAMPDYEKFR